MQLSDKHVEKYRELMKIKYAKDLSFGEARDGLLKLVLMVKEVYCPRSPERMEELMKEIKEFDAFHLFIDIVSARKIMYCPRRYEL